MAGWEFEVTYLRMQASQARRLAAIYQRCCSACGGRARYRAMARRVPAVHVLVDGHVDAGWMAASRFAEIVTGVMHEFPGRSQKALVARWLYQAAEGVYRMDAAIGGPPLPSTMVERDSRTDRALQRDVVRALEFYDTSHYCFAAGLIGANQAVEASQSVCESVMHALPGARAEDHFPKLVEHAGAHGLSKETREKLLRLNGIRREVKHHGREASADEAWEWFLAAYQCVGYLTGYFPRPMSAKISQLRQTMADEAEADSEEVSAVELLRQVFPDITRGPG